MNPNEIVKLFRDEYSFAYDDGHVVKVEENVKGGIDLQVWPGERVYIGLYSTNENSRNLLRENLSKDWKDGIVERSNGVVLKKRCGNLNDLKDMYRRMRECVMRITSSFLVATEVRDNFLIWALNQREHSVNGEKNVWYRALKTADDFVKQVRGGDAEVGEVSDIDVLDMDSYIAKNDAYDKTADGQGRVDDAGLFAVDVGNVNENDKLVLARRQALVQAYQTIFCEFCACLRDGELITEKSRVKALREKLIEMKGTDDLIRMLARSQNGKRYENYVVMGLWNRVIKACEKKEIRMPRFVTQQHVRRNGESTHTNAYIDLYIPEIKFAVECDEPHHLQNLDADWLREQDVKASGLVDGNPMHVNATMPLSEIDCRLDDISDEIMKRMESESYKGKGRDHDLHRDVISLSDEFGSRQSAIEALNIRKWRGGPYYSHVPVRGFFFKGRTWHVLFERFDLCGKAEDVWDAKMERITLKGRGSRHINSKDMIALFVEMHDYRGWAFAGVYESDGLTISRKDTQLSSFDIFDEKGL